MGVRENAKKTLYEAREKKGFTVLKETVSKTLEQVMERVFWKGLKISKREKPIEENWYESFQGVGIWTSWEILGRERERRKAEKGEGAAESVLEKEEEEEKKEEEDKVKEEEEEKKEEEDKVKEGEEEKKEEEDKVKKEKKEGKVKEKETNRRRRKEKWKEVLWCL